MMSQVNRDIGPRMKIFGGNMIYKFKDFVRMNTPIFLYSKIGDDPTEFLDGFFKVLCAIWVTSTKKANLASYQLRYVSQVWCIQWRNNRLVHSGPI